MDITEAVRTSYIVPSVPRLAVNSGLKIIIFTCRVLKWKLGMKCIPMKVLDQHVGIFQTENLKMLR